MDGDRAEGCHSKPFDLMNQSDLKADAPSARAELLAGIRAEIPVAFSVIPFGLIFGVIALGAGLPPLFAIAMSSVAPA